jgi:hypothetical protein
MRRFKERWKRNSRKLKGFNISSKWINSWFKQIILIKQRIIKNGIGIIESWTRINNKWIKKLTE